MSDRMRALATGFLYRGNGGRHGYNIWNDDNPLGKAYATGNEEIFEKALYDYYNKRGVSDRVQKSQEFWNTAEQQQ